MYEKATGKAVALAINTLHDDCCEYNTMKADPTFYETLYIPIMGLFMR